MMLDEGRGRVAAIFGGAGSPLGTTVTIRRFGRRYALADLAA